MGLCFLFAFLPVIALSVLNLGLNSTEILVAFSIKAVYLVDL